MEVLMLFENIWDIPLFWWLLLSILGTGVMIISFFWRRKKADPLKKHRDHFCRCYARGEISWEDFEELKKDLREYEDKIMPEKKRKPTPHA